MSETELKELLYRCIVELYYVQIAPTFGLCATAVGAELVEEGMKLLGVKDLSGETYAEAKL